MQKDDEKRGGLVRCLSMPQRHRARGGIMKYLITEDDAAPDARDHFDHKLKETTGLTMCDFFKFGETGFDGDLRHTWTYGGYVLIFDGDDPFYKLVDTHGEES